MPNEEIREELIRATKKKQWNELIQFQSISNQLLDDTLNMNMQAVAEGIERIHTEYAPAIHYNNESSLSSVL